MKEIIELCQNNPQIPVFLSLALGYLAGKRKIFGFSLGTTTCVLLAALVIGQVNIEIPAILKNISFALFTFCIGYKVGPQFFGALKKEGLHYIYISLVVAFVALGTTLFLGKMMHFDQGTTAGMFAGSVTQSAALGTAEGAIRHLSVSENSKEVLNTNVAVAYAITYIFGTAGMLVFLKAMPRFWRINLKDEAKKIEKQMSGNISDADKQELFSWSKRLDLRAFRVINSKVIGKTANEIERMFQTRVSIEKVKRGDQIMMPAPGMAVQENDIIVMIGGFHRFIEASNMIGPEVDDEEFQGLVGEVMKVCVLNNEVVGKTLGELSKNEMTHGIYLRKMTRQGHDVPVTRDTVVHKCDVVQIVGLKDHVEKIIQYLGYAERPTAITDLVMLGIGCVLGTMLGLVAVPIMGIPLTLGMGGGVLVVGLFFGWLRAMHPTFGQISSGGQWLLTDLGLNLFVACVGLAAGPKALHALETQGLSVFFSGIFVAILPVIAGLWFGKKVLKMNPVILLGAVAGARVLTAAINMLQEEAESAIPVLGYAVPYAFGNVLLTIWGTVIVNIM